MTNTDNYYKIFWPD